MVIIQSLKVKYNPVIPIFLGPCKNRWYHLAIFKWRKPNYSFLKEFLYLIINDSLFNFSKWGMRSGDTKKRLRFKVKFNWQWVTASKINGSDVIFSHIWRESCRPSAFKGVWFAIIVATELWLTSSEDPSGSWLMMTSGFDGAVLGPGLALKKN